MLPSTQSNLDRRSSRLRCNSYSEQSRSAGSLDLEACQPQRPEKQEDGFHCAVLFREDFQVWDVSLLLMHSYFGRELVAGLASKVLVGLESRPGDWRLFS